MLEAAEPEAEEAIPAEVLLAGSRPLPEVTEALIGACFVAFGFERVAAAVGAAFEPRIEHAVEAPVDCKSALQELLARRRARVTYEVIGESGPAHGGPSRWRRSSTPSGSGRGAGGARRRPSRWRPRRR